jgi:hypothetical protein
VTIRVTDNSTPAAFAEQSFTIVATLPGGPLPVVEAVVINQDPDAAYRLQRSLVTNVTITFSTLVNFPALAEEAFRIDRLADSILPETQVGLLVDSVTVDTSSGTPRTVARLTFVDNAAIDIINGSLPDGQYQLTVLGQRITDAAGVQLDGDRNGAPGGNLIYGDDQLSDPLVEAFFRRYGDVDGNRIVDALVYINRSSGAPRVSYGGDYVVLKDALNSTAGSQKYVSFLDFNGDGVINALDLSQGAYRVDVTRTINL